MEPKSDVRWLRSTSWYLLVPTGACWCLLVPTGTYWSLKPSGHSPEVAHDDGLYVQILRTESWNYNRVRVCAASCSPRARIIDNYAVRASVVICCWSLLWLRELTEG